MARDKKTIRTTRPKVFFVGAGPGDPDLITIKGRKLLENADVIIYAGSLVNEALLEYCKPGTELINSAEMELGEITDKMASSANAGKSVIRLQTGDPTFYGALTEQAEALSAEEIEFEVVPGVSSALASAAALKASLTMPGITQTIIFTRLSGKTPVPENESLRSLAGHGATLCIFLSAGMIEEVVSELTIGGCAQTTPVAVVYRASWPDEKIVRCTLGDMAKKVKEAGIEKHAMIIVGKALAKNLTNKALSKLYDKNFSHGYRSAK